MAEMASKKTEDEISLETTLELMNDFEKKKKSLESTISKLKDFRPNPTSPSVTKLTRSTSKQNTDRHDTERFDILSIFNQMKYLFDTNMQLIITVKDLQTKFESIQKSSSETEKSNCELKSEISKIENEIKNVSDKQEEVEVSRSAVNNDIEIVNSLNEKIVQLEQSAENNCIILQGERVDEIVRQAETNNDSIKQKITDHLTNIMPHEELNSLNEIIEVKSYGRDLKFLKIKLSNLNVKKRIIICLKKLRPVQLFVSEFLVQARLRLYHKLRIFSKTNKEKIERVFTRNGNIFYKDARNKQVFKVSSESDLGKI